MVNTSSNRRNLLLLAVFVLIASVAALTLAAPAAIPDSARLLVWTAQDAAGPGQQGASNPGQVALMDGAGNITPLLDLAEGTRYVQACGERATSPSNEFFAFYAGLDEGNLYLMRNQDAPVLVDNVLRTACFGYGTFRYSPDSTRLGYVSFEPGSATDDFADGFLKIYDIASGGFIFEMESVVAFDMDNAQVAFVQFFTNDQGEADEVAVQLWDGNNDREVATLVPEDRDRCKYVSASVQLLSNGQLALIVGQDCIGGGDTNSTWQLYTIDPAQRSATLVASERMIEGVTGGYQSFARTNVQYSKPDGSGFLFTVPDLLTANTVSLYSVDLATLAPQVMQERQVVMPGNTPPANITPRLSLDGRWLAVSETSPNNDNMLKIYDLNDLSLAPITYQAGSRGDTIAQMAFTADSSQLFAVIGGDGGTNNSIIAFNLESGSDFRVERGRFNNWMVVSPDGSEIVIGDTQILEDPQEPPYLNLVAIDVATSASTTLFEGAVVTDGEVQSQSFAVPLAWR